MLSAIEILACSQVLTSWGTRVSRHSYGPRKRNASASTSGQEMEHVASVPITEDPLTMGSGFSVEFVSRTFRLNFSGPVPDTAANWNGTHGMVLTLGMRNRSGDKLVGSGVMVAPGMAMTAKHLIEPFLDEIEAGKAQPWLTGFAPSGATFWTVVEVQMCDPHDIAYLTLVLRSPLPSDRTISVLPVSTRTPREGEVVFALGFRFEGEFAQRDQHRMTFGGRLWGASGPVSEIFPTKRDGDTIFATGPSFQIECGVVPSMSGGAVVDEDGLLLGLVSTSMDFADGTAMTMASMPALTLGQTLGFDWPDGMYRSPVSLLELAQSGELFLDGHERVSMGATGEPELREWRSRSDLDALSD